VEWFRYSSEDGKMGTEMSSRLVVVAALIGTVGCYSIHFDNGPDAPQRVEQSEWHHDGILRLVEFSSPVDLKDRCENAGWSSVRVYKSFLNGLAEAAVSLIAPLYDPWTVEIDCEHAKSQGK
jgi:hypothetical protein